MAVMVEGRGLTVRPCIDVSSSSESVDRRAWATYMNEGTEMI